MAAEVTGSGSVMEDKPYSALRVWLKALRPSPATFETLVHSAHAVQSNATLWAFAGAALAVLVIGVAATYGLISPQASLPELFTDPTMRASALLSLSIIAPLVGFSSVLGLLLHASAGTFFAGLFGGEGTVERTAYSFAAYFVPLAALAVLFTFIPVQQIRLIAWALVILYGFVLNIMATKGATAVSWNGAIGASVVVLALATLTGSLFAFLVNAVLAVLSRM